MRHETAIVFDLGGVLLDWNPRYLYRTLFDGDEERVEHFLANVCTMEWHVKHDAGRSMADGVAELVERHPSEAEFIRAFDERWREMFRGNIEGTLDILRELHGADVPLYALTNYSAEKFDDLLDMVDFIPLFRDVLVSGRVGLIKPDPAIFEMMLARFALEPARTVFIDDILANIDTAHNLGLTAIHFQNPAQLRGSLNELGLMP